MATMDHHRAWWHQSDFVANASLVPIFYVSWIDNDAKVFRLRVKILDLKIYILGEITGLWGTINFNWMKLVFLQKIM